MTRRPHQRNIWAGSDRQSRTFHEARVRSALMKILAFHRGLESIGPGMYRGSSGAGLASRPALDTLDEYMREESPLQITVRSVQ